MRREREILADRIIGLIRATNNMDNAYEKGIITEREYQSMMYKIHDSRMLAEEKFLDTYGEEPYGRPTWAQNLGAYDQYQKDNATGIYR